jgi:glycosyltransferase involved in cell wall biosynthesis
MRILVAGPPKTGTTALYYQLLHSISGDVRPIFEPRRYFSSGEDAKRTVVAKILVTGASRSPFGAGNQDLRTGVDYASFDAFEKKVLLVRDPRDRFVSSFLYSLREAPFFEEPAKADEIIRLLKAKESAPGSLSMLELMSARLRLENSWQSLEEWRENYRRFLEFCMRFPERYPSYHEIRYEDLIARRTGDLEAYLGFALSGNMQVDAAHERVARTKGQGDWKNWFLPQDVGFFRPLFAAYIQRFDYDADWEPAKKPAIPAAHASQYAQRIMRQRSHEEAEKKGQKKVSVVLPSYNYEMCVAEAVDSVIAQTYQNWELVIVDDGSTDGSAEVLARYEREFPGRIRVYFHEGRRNRGLIETYRLGLEKCGGDYVAFIEADDVWFPENLARKIAVLERHPDVAVVHSGVEMFGDDGLIRSLDEKYRWRKFLNSEIANKPFYAFTHLMRYNFLLTFSSFVTRRPLVEKADFSSKHKAWFDWWLLAQLSLQGKFFYLPEKLIKWRVHGKSYNLLYSRSIDDFREGVLFTESIQDHMKETLRKGEANLSSELLSHLDYVIKKEEGKRVPVWVLRAAKGIVKKITPPDLFQGLKRRWHRFLEPKLLANLEHPVHSIEQFDHEGLFLSGWFFLSNGTRIVHAEVFHGARPVGFLEYGNRREDVNLCYPAFEKSLYSGFAGSMLLRGNTESPLLIFGWDERGRPHKVFELRPKLDPPLRRWPSAALRRFVDPIRLGGILAKKRLRKEWMKPLPPVKILIAGLPKSGTTALFYRIKNSLHPSARSLFEPEHYEALPDDAKRTVLAKVLLEREGTLKNGFSAFDLKVLMVRDPRDLIVSDLLYSATSASFRGNPEKLEAFIRLLRRKEAYPRQVSVLDILELRARLSGQISPRRTRIYSRKFAAALEFGERSGSYQRFRYEDMVDGRFAELERLLGVKLDHRPPEEAQLRRVARTRSYGDWKNWFLQEDVDYFRPILSEYMSRYGYPDDWEPSRDPLIRPEHGSKFVEKLVRGRNGVLK